VWVLDEKGERVELMFGRSFEFAAPLDGLKFQKPALDGARALVEQREQRLPLR
jgi:hypothetical protein